MKKSLYLNHKEILDHVDDIKSPLTILTWNVMASKYSTIDNIDHEKRINSQLSFIYSQNVDICMLQEVDSVFDTILQERKDVLSRYNCYRTETLEPYGQIILSKYRLHHQSVRIGKTSEKQILIVYNPQLCIFNCHLMARYTFADQRQSQIKRIFRYIDNAENFDNANFTNILIGGDLNFCTENEYIPDWHDLCPKDKIDFQSFELKNRFNTACPKLVYESRFDRIYAKQPIDTLDYSVIKRQESDHYPVYFQLRL